MSASFDLVYDPSPQGSDEWLAARRGIITASMFKHARGKLKTGAPNEKAIKYAYRLARERCGGVEPEPFQTWQMKQGTLQEPHARRAYEAARGVMCLEQGFIYTKDRRFGLSVDSLVDSQPGAIEIKTMVSSATLIEALALGDLSEYRDQCDGAIWLLDLEWVDLVLWIPEDSMGKQMKVVRIQRSGARIEALADDLFAFEKLVNNYTDKLQSALLTMEA